MRDIRPHLVADSWSYTESVQVYFMLSIVLLEREGRGEGGRGEGGRGGEAKDQLHQTIIVLLVSLITN